MQNWSSKFITEGESLNAFDATFGHDGTKYLFLDFDDTVRHTIRLPKDEGRPPITPEEVSVFPGVGQAIKIWLNAGWKVCGTSNQKGPLRRRSYVPDFMREQATLSDAAIGCGKIMDVTLSKLGVSFPVYFCSDASVFVTENGNVRLAKGGLGQETKKAGLAAKPNPAMGEAAIATYGKPDLGNSFMIGDSYDGGDEGFAKALGFKFVNPGKLGKDFISFTDKFFNEDGVDESQSLQHSYGSNMGYNQFG
jgi:histidinol phosphatase-like enzyme